jgi:hypothetical protein
MHALFSHLGAVSCPTFTEYVPIIVFDVSKRLCFSTRFFELCWPVSQKQDPQFEQPHTIPQSKPNLSSEKSNKHPLSLASQLSSVAVVFAQLFHPPRPT